MKIRSRITLSFFLLSLCPLIVMGALAHITAKSAIRDGLGQSFHRMAHGIIDKVDENIYYARQKVEIWSGMQAIRAVLTGDPRTEFFSGLASQEKDFSHVSVLDARGEVAASTYSVGTGISLAQEEFFRKAMAGEAYTGDVAPGRLTGRHEVTFAFPVRAQAGKGDVIGVLAAGWKMKNLTDLVRREEFFVAEEGYSRISFLFIDRFGVVIEAPENWKEFLYRENLLERGFQSAALVTRQKEGYLLEKDRQLGEWLIGYDYSRGFRDFPGLGWSALAVADSRFLFGPAQRLKYNVFFIGGIVVALVLTLSWFLSRKISGPLSVLVDAAEKVGRGEFTGQIEIRADEELNHLAAAFNRMTGSLRETTISRDYLDNVFLHMGNALIVLDAEGKIQTVNKAAGDLLGYDARDLIGSPMKHLFAPADCGIVSRVIQQPVENVELSYQTRGGGNVPVIFSSSLLKDRGDRVSHIICVAQDIRERKEAEARNARLATAFESVADAIMITDTGAVIQYVNPSFERITGYAAGEAIGRKCSMLKSGAQDESFYRRMWKTLRRGQTWSGALINRRKNGEPFDVEEVIGVVRDSSGAIINYVAVMRDVTEQNKARSWQAQLATAMDHVGESVLITDCDGVIRYVNIAFASITGYSPREVIGRNPRVLKSGLQDAAFYKRMWETLLKGETWSAVITNRKKDGSLYTCEQTVVPVKDASGRIINFVGVHHDITARLKMEEDLRRANKDLAARESAMRQIFTDLQKAHEDLKSAQRQMVQAEKLASIGQLSAGVAHEINNPLGFIINNVDVLRGYVQEYEKCLRGVDAVKLAIGEGDMEKIKSAADALQKIEEEINLDYIRSDADKLLRQSGDGLERIKKIVADLRAFAREEKAETRETIRIETIIDGILDILQNELKYKADLTRDYGDTPAVKCNHLRLGQVFMNLLVNAAQAMETRGKIAIRTYARDNYVCVDIADTGKGIPAHDLARIFDPFFTTKPVGQGTGLGLSVSYEIVQKHGGEMKVESKEGEGAVFTVMLPVERDSR